MEEQLSLLLQEWKRSGAVDAGARVLQARRRSGELGEPNLHLVAYLGGPCARELLGSAAPSAPRDYAAWVQGLSAWGKEVEVRAGVAAGELLAPLWEKAEPRDLSPRKTLAVLREWLADPTDRNLARVRQTRFDAVYRDPKATVAAGLISHLATALSYGDEPLSSCAIVAATLTAPETIRAAIAASLSSWALGYDGARLVTPPTIKQSR